MDRGQWAVAAQRFREALAEESQESEKRVFVSGVFSYPYLPHFYLGWALYKADLAHCEEALRELEISQQQGVVRRFRRQLKELEDAKEACNGRLLPAAAAAAAQAVQRAMTLAEGLGQVLADASLEAERQSARTELDAARGTYQAAQASARIQDYRRAESQADSARERLAALDRRLASLQGAGLQGAGLQEAALQDTETQGTGLRPQETGSEGPPAAETPSTTVDPAAEETLRMDGLVRAASVAISAAEVAAQELDAYLTDPGWAEARRALPEVRFPLEARALIREAKEKVASRESPVTVEAARRDALAAAEQVRQMHDLARQRFTAWNGSRQGQEGEVIADLAPVSPERATGDSATEDLATEDPVIASTQLGAESRGRDSGAVGRELEAARELLRRLAGDQGGRLFSLQRSRLEGLVVSVGEVANQADTTEDDGLRRRLVESMAALRVIAGARAFLSSEPEHCIEILEDGEYGDPRLAGEAYLFLSAARFALFRRSGETDTRSREQAAAAARQSHLSVPARTLDGGLFSPAFRRLFLAAAP